MSRLKSRLGVVAGVVIGIVALRALRERQRTPRDEAEAAVEDALEEAGVATEHATAAIGHARVAGQKAVEHAREEYQPQQGDVVEVENPRSLRRVGKGWIRR